MEFKVDVSKLTKTFAQLPRSTQNKALRPALRAGAKVIQQAAITNVNRITQEESTGLLAKSIVVRAMRKFRGMNRVSVQIKKGATYPNKTDKNGRVRVAAVAAILEYRDGGKYSWLRKASREKAQLAINAVSSEARKNMSQAISDAKV